MAPIPTFRDFVKFCFASCLLANRQADDVELAVVRPAHENASVPASPTRISTLSQVNTVGLVAEQSSNQARIKDIQGTIRGDLDYAAQEGGNGPMVTANPA